MRPSSQPSDRSIWAKVEELKRVFSLKKQYPLLSDCSTVCRYGFKGLKLNEG